MTPIAAAPSARRRRFYADPSLQVLAGMLVGVVLGFVDPAVAGI